MVIDNFYIIFIKCQFKFFLLRIGCLSLFLILLICRNSLLILVNNLGRMLSLWLGCLSLSVFCTPEDFTFNEVKFMNFFCKVLICVQSKKFLTISSSKDFIQYSILEFLVLDFTFKCMVHFKLILCVV